MINSNKLSDLRPDVRVNCEAWLAACKAAGLKVIITQTLRDNEYQAQLYAKGRTKPGRIVTNSKTTTFHGKGLAFDFCKNVKCHEYDDLAFFRKAADIAKRIGFSWGGDWKRFTDNPHIQWDNGGRYSDRLIRLNILPPAMPKYNERGTVCVNVDTLAKGSAGSQVRALQALLNGYGYSCGSIDGSFGTKTHNALVRYQKAKGLSADGSCGPATWRSLLGA